MNRCIPWNTLAAILILSLSLPSLMAADARVSGHVADPQSRPVAGAIVRLTAANGVLRAQTTTDSTGFFTLKAPEAGNYEVEARAPDLGVFRRSFGLDAGEERNLDLQFPGIASRRENLTVSATAPGPDLQHPDPSQIVNVRDDLLDANPGRPGAPVSIPGLPIESASGGIKAPQYFAPGVAGDHGEPIAQFFQVGAYLAPNNLSANAHGNGYADPNVLVPAVIESVETDGGAFNVREGNHSVNAAAAYGFQPRLEPFATLTGDSRDLDLAAGWSPANPAARAWVALEAAYGNGLLDTPEHRRQYKLNAFRVWEAGNHAATLFAIGYYGQSHIPGLVPIDSPGLHDTIDPRQRDQTHTGEAVVNDVWRLASAGELQISAFFRTYNLSLDSNFGDGLIRQSEFRIVAGGDATYLRRFNRFLALMAGAGYLREAPRRLDLDHYLSTDPAVYGPFEKVTANNVTLASYAPFVALDGRPASWLHYDLAWRRDDIDFRNTDLLRPQNSYIKWAGVDSPKANFALLPPERLLLPSLSFSFGQAFFTDDPRSGTGATRGTLVSRAHSYQMLLSRTLRGTDLRLTLGRVTQEQSLARIDPDTGLQYDQGPGRNRYLTASARHVFGWGMLQTSVSKADARDLVTGAPVPEAPRQIVDFLASIDRLPWGLQARAEYEAVGRKPLGDGFVAVPVKEFRGALLRRFGPRLEAGVHFLVAAGYTGQTTEVLALPGEAAPFERIVGVRLPSYAALSLRYRLGRR